MPNFISKSFCVIFFTMYLFGCDRPTEVNLDDDGFPPSVPAGLNVYAQQDGEVGLEWERNVDADLKGYNIYRKTDSTDFHNVGFTTDIFFIDDSLDYNTVYSYQITAVDNFNRESAPSKVVSAKPVNIYRPLSPRSLSINARNWENELSIYLNWQGSFETDIKGYNVYRNSSSSFTPDTASFLGFTAETNFTDTFDLSLYKEYYYIVKTQDKGGLLSRESEEVSDKILGAPELIFPTKGAEIKFFDKFIIKTVEVPADYKIIVQTNKFFGEFWIKSFHSSVIEDTVKINFDPPFVETGKAYYWRAATFTKSVDPNSVSELYKFTIKP